MVERKSSKLNRTLLQYFLRRRTFCIFCALSSYDLTVKLFLKLFLLVTDGKLAVLKLVVQL